MNSTDSAGPPPNTPEKHCHRMQRTIKPNTNTPQTGNLGYVSRHSSSSPTADIAFRLSKQSPFSTQSKTKCTKTRTFRRHMREDSENAKSWVGKAEKSASSIEKDVLVPMLHIAPAKMLIHQWLTLGSDEKRYRKPFLPSRFNSPQVQIPQTSQRTLGDMFSKKAAHHD